MMDVIRVNYTRDGKPTSTTVGLHVAHFWATTHGIDKDKVKEYVQRFVRDQSIHDPIQGKQDLEARLLADTITK